jgi:glycosyltransferase involved in cell wall biosynthesis
MQIAHSLSVAMKVLVIHNKYKEAGGEDVVFQAEGALLSKNGHFVETLIFDNSKIKTVIDKFLCGLKVIYNPGSARALRRKIENFKPDIIHVHNFVPLASPSVFFVASKYNIPVILTLHNYRLICPSLLFHKNKIYEKSIHTLFPIDAILKGVYRDSRLQTAAVVIMTALHAIIGTWRNKVDLYITLTQFARKKFETAAISIPASKLVVKPNFVVDYGRGDVMRKDFFLFVGRITEEKGIRTLLKATRLANFKLVIIGEGPLSKLVTDFAKENRNVSYIGFQDKPTVMNYMKICRGLIFPSLWYEGFPVTILEALSAGTIVITSKLGGMAEIIEDQVNGLHFEAGNEKDLVSRIAEINHSPQYLKSLSDNARLTYLEHYTPEKNYALLMEIYNRALASSRQAQKISFYKPVQQSG